MATSLRLTQEDRARIAEAKKILEKENGIPFSIVAVLRAVLYFFLEAKRKQTPSK